ncbi:MAG: GspE/PulE family protein [Candidatus Sericytochromatia bacterium]
MTQAPASPAPFRLGELLLKEGYLTTDALAKVLALQKQGPPGSYRPFGQICIELNLISPEELQRVLRKHNKRIQLGELLVNMRVLRASQVESALQQQKKEPAKKLGQIMLALKLLNENQLVDALSIQLDVPRILPSLELMDLDLLKKVDPEWLKRDRFLPVHLKNEQLTVVMENPQEERLLKQLERHFKCLVLPAIAPASALQATIEAYLQQLNQQSRGPKSGPAFSQPISMTLSEEDKVESYEPSALAGLSLYDEPVALAAEPEVPAPQQTLTVGGVNLYVNEAQRKQEETVVNFLFKNALKDRASDIHIEPQEKYLRIRYRIDGVLHHKTDLPQDLAGPMLSRLKQLSALNPENTLGHQRNRVQATLMDRQMELGVATYPSLWGETMVLNIHERQSSSQELLLNLERTGFSPLCLHRYQKLLNQPGGLIILTGPARSGKTSTLYASINYLNQQNRSIMTAENPIEMQVPGTVQGQWTSQRGDSFAEMIRSMSFLDPDILMVSQLESPDILEATTELALTGAKVITSYPAFDATGALLRLANQGLESYLIASSHVAVLSQRLVRRLCPDCKRPEPPSRELLDLLGLVSVAPEAYPLYQPVGCANCLQHGYKGQIAIHELLIINEAIREAILDRKPAATIRGIARTEAKLVSMAEDGYFKAVQGLTSLNEVQRVAFVNEYDSQTPWEAEEIHAICLGQESEFL